MENYIENRVLEFARLILQNKCTIRDIAKLCNVSKSTAHKDLNERLHELDIDLWEKVKAVLDFNLSEKHIRGGQATKEKYEKIKEV